jgi:hypothetical protein
MHAAKRHFEGLWYGFFPRLRSEKNGALRAADITKLAFKFRGSISYSDNWRLLA